MEGSRRGGVEGRQGGVEGGREGEREGREGGRESEGGRERGRKGGRREGIDRQTSERVDLWLYKSTRNDTLVIGVPGWGKIKISLIRFCFPAAFLPLVSKVIIGIGKEKVPSTCKKQTKNSKAYLYLLKLVFHLFLTPVWATKHNRKFSSTKRQNPEKSSKKN